MLYTTACSTYQPVENDPAQLGLNAAQQLQLEEVLTQAIGALVAGTYTAWTGVAAERQRNVCVFTRAQQQQHKCTYTYTHTHTHPHPTTHTQRKCDRQSQGDYILTVFNHKVQMEYKCELEATPLLFTQRCKTSQTENIIDVMRKTGTATKLRGRKTNTNKSMAFFCLNAFLY